MHSDDEKGLPVPNGTLASPAHKANGLPLFGLSPFDSPPSSAANGTVTSQRMLHCRKSPKDGTDNAAKARRTQPRFYLSKFRVPIYVQLCVVICVLCGICVMIVAVTTVRPLLRVC
jgi:hypothetical protein